MLTRRKLLATAAGAAVAMPSIIRPARAQGRPFTFCSWGGALSETEKKAFLAPYAKQTGLDVAYTSPTNYAKIKAMVAAGAVQWDLVTVGGYFIFQGRDAHLLEPIDYTIVKTGALEPFWKTEYGVYTTTGATVIAYNTDTFPNGAGPQSWKDFWNVKDFPGPRGLYSRLWYNYEAALLAAGVPRNEIYPATDEKMKLALAKLTELKPHVAVWWTAGAQPPQLLATGELAMAMAWSGRVFDAIQAKAPIATTFNDALAWGNAFVVPKGSPYRDTAMKIIGYSVTPEAQERLLPMGTYGPVLGTVAAKATPEQARTIVTYPDNLKHALIFNDEAVAAYVEKYDPAWQKFQLE